MLIASAGARAWYFGAILAATLASGVLIGVLMPPLVVDDGYRRDFFTSAGFAGSMALAAAIVAYVATRRSAQSTVEQAQADRALAERRDRKAQWWARAEWALNQVR